MSQNVFNEMNVCLNLLLTYEKSVARKGSSKWNYNLKLTAILQVNKIEYAL